MSIYIPYPCHEYLSEIKSTNDLNSFAVPIWCLLVVIQPSGKEQEITKNNGEVVNPAVRG